MTLQEINQRIKDVENKQANAILTDNEEQEKEALKELEKLWKIRKQYVKTTTATTVKEKPKPEIKYETFNDPNLNCNQWVIEIHKAGSEINGKFIEDFSVYKDLKYALARLGDTRTCMYFLMDYLNDNKQKFNFVLWRQNFENLTSFKEQTYRDSVNALFYYGVFEKTNRVKRNEKNVCCKVYIFHADLSENELPKEKFNPKNPEHIKIIKERKG